MLGKSKEELGLASLSILVLIATLSGIFNIPFDLRTHSEVVRFREIHNDYGQVWRYDIWVKGEEFAFRYSAYCAQKELNAQGEVERYYGGTGYRCLELEEIPKIICHSPSILNPNRWAEKC